MDDKPTADDVIVAKVIPIEHLIEVAAKSDGDQDDDPWRRRIRNVARAGRVRLERPGATKAAKVLEWALFDLAYFLAVEDPDSCWLVELEHLSGVMQTATPYAAERIMRVRYHARDVYRFASEQAGANALKPMAEEGWRLRALIAHLRADRQAGDVVTVITGRKDGRQAVDKVLGI